VVCTPHTLDGNKVSFEQTYPDRSEAMARAFLMGVYNMRVIAVPFRVHYSAVRWAVRWVEA
jgi:hypothetical protein